MRQVADGKHLTLNVFELKQDQNDNDRASKTNLNKKSKPFLQIDKEKNDTTKGQRIS